MQKYETIVFSEIGLRQTQRQIETLRQDLGASGAMLLDQAGHLLVECGTHGDFDPNTFLALLGNAMSASNAVIHLLRDTSAFDLHIHEGTSYEMYTSRINDQIFLTLTFEKRPGTSRVGMVWITLRRAIVELRELIDQAAVKPGTIEDKQIQNAISSTLAEALNRMEGDMFTGNPPHSTTPAADPRNNSVPPSPIPNELMDPNRTISYEEARRLGLINLDDNDLDSRA